MDYSRTTNTIMLLICILALILIVCFAPPTFDWGTVYGLFLVTGFGHAWNLFTGRRKP